MKLKPNYIIIPLVAVVFGVLSGVFSSWGVAWYNNELIKPDFAPSLIVCLIVWLVVFVMAVISALIAWNKRYTENKFLLILKKKEIDVIFVFVIGLFIVNAVFSVMWSLLFFVLHQISLTLFEMFILEITTLVMIGLMWNRSRVASLLLIPYATCMAFVTYLIFQIMILN